MINKTKFTFLKIAIDGRYPNDKNWWMRLTREDRNNLGEIADELGPMVGKKAWVSIIHEAISRFGDINVNRAGGYNNCTEDKSPDDKVVSETCNFPVN